MREGVRTIILDSWTNLTNELQPPNRAKLEKIVVRLAKTKNVRLVFIVDQESESEIEGLADSIVILHRLVLDQGVVREIEWVKFERDEEQEVGLFTLSGGRFERIRPPQTWKPKGTPAVNVPRAKRGEIYSTGSKEVDDFIGGGLRKRSVVLIETGPNLGKEWVLTIMASISVNFLSAGGSLLALHSVSTDPDVFLRSIRPYVLPSAFDSNFRLLSYAFLLSPNVIHLSGAPRNDLDLMRSTARELKRGTVSVPSVLSDTLTLSVSKSGEPDKDCLVYLSLDNYQVHGEDPGEERAIFKMIEEMREDGDILVLSAKPSTRDTQLFSDLSDTHLFLDQVDGCLVLFPKKPLGGPHALTFEYDGGLPKVRLTPIL